MRICLSRWCFMASNGAVCLSKLRFFRSKSEFVCLKYVTFVSPREY
jgi:hypothetical protein